MQNSSRTGRFQNIGGTTTKATDLLEHFLARADWMDRAKTVDRIIAGDPERDFDRCLVVWMPGMDALRIMVARGISLLVAHEPTFYNHGNDRPGPDEMCVRKQKFIEDNGIVIVRTHDCWDLWPGIGIPWAWAKFLGFKGASVATGLDGYQHRYDTEPIAFGEFARGVAARCATIGESAVQVIGRDDTKVARIGVGTGCACQPATFMEMGCDCSIVCDDGCLYWSAIQQAADMGHPVIRVNHGTSEEPGMKTLTDYINREIPGLSAEHLPQGSMFRLAGTVSALQ